MAKQILFNEAARRALKRGVDQVADAVGTTLGREVFPPSGVKAFQLRFRAPAGTKFESTETQIFGISVDSVPANKEFGKQNSITFPLLSDFKRTVVKDYGIFNEEGGYGNRATFVIDKDGIIQHIDEGSVAIDPAGAADACNILTHKKATP